MRILYIVGNGFDLNLGLKTDYHSFYKYYLDQPTSNPAILKLKEKINQEQYTNWSDLELGLGRYASECTKDEYLLILDDIRTNLTTYLNKQIEFMSFSLTGTFVDDLRSPEQYLEKTVLDGYNLYSNTFLKDGEPHFIDIITFNYTYTLEDILYVRSSIGGSIINLPKIVDDITMHQLVHIHGTIHTELNLGVNDVTQINNESFRDDQDVIDNTIKPEFNDACLNGKNDICEDMINNADLIVLFGVSIGMTDSKWWSLIGDQIKQRHCAVMYYPFDKNKDDEKHPNLKRRWTNEYISFLKDRMGIPNDKDASFPGLIVVGINKPFFKEVIIRNQKEEGRKK